MSKVNRRNLILGTAAATAASVVQVKASPSKSLKDDLLLYTYETATLGRQHEEWLKRLQDVEDGKIKRLLGLTPQDWDENEHTSVLFTTHYLGRFPGKKIIVSSDWQAQSSWRARRIVDEPYYKEIFNTELSSEPLMRFDSSGVDEWELSNGSCYYYRSISVGCCGGRVDGIIWYDPVRYRKSETITIEEYRNKCWESYICDFVTRKKPNTFEVGICERGTDFPSRILPVNYDNKTGWVKGQDGNDWYVVCLPNIYDWL